MTVYLLIPMTVYILIIAAACELFSGLNFRAEMYIIEKCKIALKAGLPVLLPEGFWGAYIRSTISLVAFVTALIAYPSVTYLYMLPISCLSIAQLIFKHKQYASLFILDYLITATCYFFAALAIQNI